MKFVVPSSLDGERVDRAVAMLTELPRSIVGVMIDDGKVVIDGEPAKKSSQKVDVDASIELELPQPKRESLKPDDEVDFEIKHVDDDVIVINKPAGLTVHPGNGTHGSTLANGLIARFPELMERVPGNDPDRPGIVHRLDSTTSGLMVVARTRSAHEKLVDALSRHEVTRNYLALVWGAPKYEAGVVDAPVGRSSRDRTAMAVTQGGRPAKTLYRLVATAELPEVSLLALGLETGRTHQIRVHMRALGNPVVGDSRYGGRRQTGMKAGGSGANSLGLTRPFLHAYRLGFIHPTSGDYIQFDAPLPDELSTVLAKLGLGLKELPEGPQR